MTRSAESTAWRLGRLPIGNGSLVWMVPGLVAIAILFVWPVLNLLAVSVNEPAGSTSPYITILSEPIYLRVIRNTAVSTLGTTLVCLLIGYPTAYAIHVLSPPWRLLILSAVLFSYAVGTMPRAFSWIVLLGDRGLVNQALTTAIGLQEPIQMLYNQTGVIVGMTHVMLPLMVLTLLGAMARVPDRLILAARTLGAGPFKAFVLVFLPLTMPGVLAGLMMTFIYSLGFFVVPAVLGGAGQTTVVMVLRDLTLGMGRWGLGSALSMTVIAICIVGTAIYVPLARIGQVEEQ